MKIVAFRRTVLARCVCPQCHEPARRFPPYRWTPAYGPRPSWSHWDGEPLCPVVGANGYRPARRGCVLTALRPARASRSVRHRSRVALARRAVARRTVRRPVGAPPRDTGARDTGDVYLVAGGDMVAVFDSLDAAGIMAVTMTRANLEPVTLRVSPAQWDRARAVLHTEQPHITVTDARSGRAGAS